MMIRCIQGTTYYSLPNLARRCSTKLSRNAVIFPHYRRGNISDKFFSTFYSLCFQTFLSNKKRFSFVVTVKHIETVLNFISENPVTVHQIVCNTGIHARTVRKCLQILELANSSRRINRVVKDSRVLYKKEG